MKSHHSVAIVAIARLENPYINEWIRYHRGLGFDHIYVYDNSCGNEVHIDKVLNHEVAECTTVVDAYDKDAYQKFAYEDAYKRFGTNHEYMLYIDVDEFFTLMHHKTISEYIDFLNSKCPNFQSCRIHWEIYDDNNAVDRDIKIPVVEFFTHKATTNTAVSTNYQTKALIKCGIPKMRFTSVHYSVSSAVKLKTCNSTGERISSDSKITIAKRNVGIAKIRHYMTKTIAEYMRQKLCRADAAGYMTRDIENKFFNYCRKTDAKVKYYNANKNKIKIQKTVPLKFWYWQKSVSSYNAGDDYNRYLVNRLYSCKTIKTDNPKQVDAVFCGSILMSPFVQDAKYVVGCGIQHTKTGMPPMKSNYLAVRGRISLVILETKFKVKLNQNVLLFDPGLLLSRLYQPKKPIQKKYKVGIIPHYQDERIVRSKYGKNAHIISMQTNDIERLADEILSCEVIISSSLHGIIFAHSYGVPAYHCQITDLMKNGNFKFNDYYSSFDCEVEYKRFFADKFGNLPIGQILEYDGLNREKANPKMDEIKKKQQRFLEILPYKNAVKKEFGGMGGTSLNSEV